MPLGYPKLYQYLCAQLRTIAMSTYGNKILFKLGAGTHQALGPVLRERKLIRKKNQKRINKESLALPCQ